MINDEKVFFAYNKFNVTLCLEYTYAYFFQPFDPRNPPPPPHHPPSYLDKQLTSMKYVR